MELSTWLRYLERQKKKEEKKILKEKKKKKGKKELLLERDKLESEQDRLSESEDKLVVEPEEKYESVEYESKKDSKLELLGLDDAKPAGYGHGRYWAYSEALKSGGLLDEIKELLDEQNFIIVRNIDVAEKLGKHFVEKHPSSIYAGLKYTLFNEGIVCEERAHVSDIGNLRRLLFMRKRNSDDHLPHSMESNGKKKKKLEKS